MLICPIASPDAGPTPYTTVCPTLGTYVVPEKPETTTVTEETTITVPTTAWITPGTNVYGGTTTVASVSTVVVYPAPDTFPAGVYTQAVTTVTAVYTSQVFVCPFESTSTVTVESTQVVTATPVPVAAAYTPAAAAPAPAASASAPAPAAAPGNNIVTNGNQWAMTYTPYDSTGNCKTADVVSSDLAAIKAKGFTTIRLYGTDCSGLTNVGGAAVAQGMKIILGIFIEGSGIAGAQSQLGQVTAWGSQGSNWASVVMLVVGNEAISQGFCDGPSLAGFISQAKSALQAAGAGNVPVTTTEPLNILMANKDALCPVIDVVAANLQSYFNGGIEASQAGTFVASQLQLVAQQCPGKTAYNLESGWPSGGSSNGASVASPEAQQAAIADIVAKVGQNTVIFSYSNDGWKQPGSLGVEQFFGCAQYFSG
jgi:exo-beta-1,3-glucanase (GH17 family)